MDFDVIFTAWRKKNYFYNLFTFYIYLASNLHLTFKIKYLILIEEDLNIFITQRCDFKNMLHTKYISHYYKPDIKEVQNFKK